MSQITIYTPDPIAVRAKTAAQQAHLSLSSWITQVITEATDPNLDKAPKGWPDDFWSMVGSWKDSDFPTTEQMRATDVPDLPRVF